MNKDFNNKKKLTIAGLVVVAVALVGGIYHFTTNTNADVPADDETEIEEQLDVVVPDLDNVIVIDPSILNGEKEDVSDDVEVKVEVETPSTTKPATKEEAVAPTDDTPPVVNDQGEEEVKVYEPNKPSESAPSSGDTNSSGDIYVPGFGYIPYEGSNSNIDAPNAGTGEIIGSMG